MNNIFTNNIKKIEFDEVQDKIAYFEDSNLNIINSKYRKKRIKQRKIYKTNQKLL